MEEFMSKKTILYDEHVKLGGKIVEFAGYLLPIEYSGITQEHQAVREGCGLFDVSHMGEIAVRGIDTLKFVNWLVTNDIINAPTMKMTYGILLYPNGFVIDDLMVYKFTDDYCLLCVNASNKDKDLEWILAHQKGFDVQVKDESDYYSQLALQGPKAHEVLQKLTDFDLGKLKMMEFAMMKIQKSEFLVSRSGYTGEDGFEIYGANQDILALFRHFETIPEVTLCGLGCRDTLRFEAAMPLYGHEIDDTINPLEAGLNYGVKLDKDFIGREALLQAQKEGLKRKVVALELTERGIARNGYEVEADGKVIGRITTGYMIPNTEKALAFALIDSAYAVMGNTVQIRIRKNLVSAKIRNKKFLEKKYVR